MAAVATKSRYDEMQAKQIRLNLLMRMILDNRIFVANPPLLLYKALGRHIEPPYWDDVQ